jgi:hypothetical protein
MFSCVEPDDPRPMVGWSARAQGRRRLSTASGSRLAGGTPLGRSDPNVYLRIDRPPKAPLDDVQSKRSED